MNSNEAEMGILGAILHKPDILGEVAEHVRPPDFWSVPNRAIYTAMLALAKRRKPVDLVTVGEQLKRRGLADLIPHLAGLAEEVPTAANAIDHALIVRDYSVRRTINAKALALAEEVLDRDANIADVIESASQTLLSLTTTSRTTQEYHRLADLVEPALKEIEDRYNAGGGLTGLSTGFTELDALLGGMQSGDLIVVAGRPSMGKTAFALDLADHQECNVLLFSLEMSNQRLVERQLSKHSGIPSHVLRTGNLSDKHWAMLIEGGGTLVDGSSVLLDDTGALPLQELTIRARQAKRREGVGLVVVDYLQLITSKGNTSQREREVASISRGLKFLAKELQCPVVALSQLSRAVETRTDKRPTLSDLRESGAIEQDADVVAFLFRPEVYFPNDDQFKGRADLIVAKQRNGPTGTVKLRWDATRTTFSEPEAPKQEGFF